MEFLSILLAVVAFVTAFGAVSAFVEAAIERDPEFLLIALACATIALGTGLSSAAAYKTHQTTWQKSDTIVRTVFNEGEDAMLLTKYGIVYRCVTPAQCSKLEKGDHVTFRLLPGGSSVPGTPDIDQVVKG